MRRMLMLGLCASWRGLRRYRRNANHRFAFFHLDKQIGDLLFFRDSWIFFRSHKEKQMEKDLQIRKLKNYSSRSIWIKICISRRTSIFVISPKSSICVKISILDGITITLFYNYLIYLFKFKSTSLKSLLSNLLYFYISCVFNEICRCFWIKCLNYC